MRQRLLLHLDVGLPGALLRTALGAALVPLLHAFTPEAGVGLATAALLVLLFGVKAFAAVARRFVGAGPEVRATWEYRRNLAKHHDAYQWRKLLWFGAGILAASRGTGKWALPLGAACLAAGAVGELLWRRAGIPTAVPQRG